jgi:hypothetical protein
VQVGDEHRSLGEGEEALVPPGTPHRWYNEAEQEEALVLGEVRPALNTETFLETMYGLARDGETDENGVPNLLQQSVTLIGINKGEIYLAWPPIAVQKVLLAALAPAGRVRLATKSTTRSTVQWRLQGLREQARHPQRA